MIIEQVAYAFIALIAFLLVNLLGALMEDKGYADINSCMDFDKRVFNAIFRVVSPVVIWCFLLWILDAVGADVGNDNSWFVLIYYWGYRFIVLWMRGRTKARYLTSFLHVW